jgi:hypothetical protein
MASGCGRSFGDTARPNLPTEAVMAGLLDSELRAQARFCSEAHRRNFGGPGCKKKLLAVGARHRETLSPAPAWDYGGPHGGGDSAEDNPPSVPIRHASDRPRVAMLSMGEPEGQSDMDYRSVLLAIVVFLLAVLMLKLARRMATSQWVGAAVAAGVGG